MIAVVETQMVSSSWTAIFTAISACLGAITPVFIFIYGWAQRKRETKASKTAEVLRVKTEMYERETKVSLAILQSTTHQTHILVNSRFGMVLRKLAELARNHATMARAGARLSKEQGDMSVATAAEAAADAAEADYQLHERQQLVADAAKLKATEMAAEAATGIKVANIEAKKESE